MTSYLLEYDIIFNGILHHIIYIGIWNHIYWNVASIYWNMAPHELEYVVISIGIYNHIKWNILSYLLKYVIIFIHCYIARVIKITSKQLQA